MLSIQALHVVFNPGSVNEVHSLRGIDLHLPAEQFVTLIGSNGSGKTTLFNTIAGAYAADARAHPDPGDRRNRLA